MPRSKQRHSLWNASPLRFVLKWTIGEVCRIVSRPKFLRRTPSGKDGKTRALIKLVSALLHVDFDLLYQREKKRRARRLIFGSMAATCALALLVGLGWTGLEQSRLANWNERTTETRRLSRESDAALKEDPQRSILLAVAAARLWKRTDETPLVAQQALRNALEISGGWGLTGHSQTATGPRSRPVAILLNALTFSPDSTRLFSGGADGTIHIWDLRAQPAAAGPLLLLHEPVRSLAVSPLGKHVAGFGTHGKGLYWDLEGSADDFTLLDGPTDSVTVARFSPDRRWLATGSADGRVVLWPVANDFLVPAAPTILDQGASVIGLAFATDASWIATAGVCVPWNKNCDGGLTVWDLAQSDRPEGRRILSGVDVMSIDVSEDAHVLATATGDGVVRIWDAASFRVRTTPIGELTIEPRIESEPVNLQIALAPRGDWLVTSSRKTGVALRRANHLADPPIVLRGPGAEEVFGLAFSRDGRWVAVGGDKPTLWRLREGVVAGSEPIPGFAGLVLATAFSPDGRWLAAGGNDASVRVWNLGQNLSAKAAWYTAVQRGENLGLALAAGLRKFLAIRRPPPLASTASKPLGKLQMAGGLAISGEGRRLADTDSSKNCRIWRLDDQGVPESSPLVLKPACGTTLISTFSPDGNWLAAGGDDGKVRLWNLARVDSAPEYWEIEPELDRLREAQLGLRRLSVTRLSFCASGRLLAVAMGEEGGTIGIVGIVRISDRNVESLALGPAHTGEVSALDFAQDCQRLLTAGTDGVVRLWSLKDRLGALQLLQEFRGHEGWVHSAAISPDGRWLAAGGGHIKQNGADTLRTDSRVLLWDLHDASKPPIPLIGHRGWITQTAFSPDGAWLATAGEDGTRLWRVATDNPTESVLLNSGALSAIAFATDNAWLLTVGSDAIVAWDLDMQALIQRAQQAVGRNFSEEEWRRYFPNQPPAAVFPKLINPYPSSALP
jgi:WD40 repeat protein